MIVIPLSRPPVDDEIRRAVLAAIDARQIQEGLVREILSLPLSASHTEAEIDQMAEAIRAFFGR